MSHSTALDQQITAAYTTVADQARSYCALVEQRLTATLRAALPGGGILRTALEADVEGRDVAISGIDRADGTTVADSDSHAEEILGDQAHQAVMADLRHLLHASDISGHWSNENETFSF